jgi:hypothetical protein
MEKQAKKAKPKLGAIDRFLALPDVDKERIYQEIDGKTPEEIRARSRALTPAERNRLERFRRGLRGRPKVKEGAKAVNITVERSLLRRADAWAQEHGLTRAQLIARGLELVMRG